MTATTTTVTVREAIRHRLCTGGCLSALEADRACTCRCGGRWHGALAQIDLVRLSPKGEHRAA